MNSDQSGRHKENPTIGVNYFYCATCGFEKFSITLEWLRKADQGDVCLCPKCRTEVVCEADS